MSSQIIQQPNGLYAVWSSIVDSFTLIDATPEEIVEEWVAQERQRLTEAVNRIVGQLNNNQAPYCQFTMTWEEALATHERVHGEPFNLESRCTGK
jgi:hypothetical protein